MTRLVVSALVVALASSVAHAEIDPDARAKLVAGNEHFEAKRFSQALVEYQAAYKIDPDPDILFAIAQAERFLGRCDLALPRFREYLASRTDFPIQLQGPIADCWRQLPPAAAQKPCSSTPDQPVERGLPWYKNPASGAVIVGTAGIAIGVGFLFAASATREQADSEQFSDDFDRKLDEATGERRIGVTFLVTGAALAGGGIAYHFWSKWRSSQSSVRPTTAVTTDGRSITFARSF
ncbi:MAG: tetratricopeptide repeat protein [Kofleriaceae bacterium]